MIGQVNKMLRANAEKLIAGDLSGMGAFLLVGEDKNSAEVVKACIDRATKWLEEHK